MAIRTLAYGLAAAAMTVAATAQAAAPVSAPVRSSASLEEADALGGDAGWLPVLIAALAIASIMIFNGEADDEPISP